MNFRSIMAELRPRDHLPQSQAEGMEVSFLEQLGLPLGVRAPEACKSLKNSVEGKPIDIWAFGVMILHIFTNWAIYEKATKRDNWKEDLYPHIYEILQGPFLLDSLKTYFPACKIDIVEVKLALDFIHMFLRYKPKNRWTAEQLLTHIFLNRGVCYGSGADNIWKVFNNFESKAPREKTDFLKKVVSRGTQTDFDEQPIENTIEVRPRPRKGTDTLQYWARKKFCNLRLKLKKIFRK